MPGYAAAMLAIPQTIRPGILIIGRLAAKREQEDRHSSTRFRCIHESDLH